MLTAEKIKHVLSILLLACFFLPLCQCTARMPASADGKATTTTEVLVPYEKIQFKDIDGLPLIALFVWPICLWRTAKFASTRHQRIAVGTVEILCSVLSIVYLILVLQFWSEVRYGGVITFLALIAHGVTSAISTVRLARHEAS